MLRCTSSAKPGQFLMCNDISLIQHTAKVCDAHGELKQACVKYILYERSYKWKLFSPTLLTFVGVFGILFRWNTVLP